MWNLDDILAVLASTIRVEHDRLTLEQAVHNLDALDEVQLHPVLAAGLAREGFGVLREQPYPSEWLSKPGRNRKALPDESQRLRCDLVLTPEPGQVLIDPLLQQRATLEDLKQAERTLFMPVAKARAARAGPPEVVQGIAPDDACWLELKVVGQFCHTSGVPGANGAYGSQFLRSVMTDLRKLAGDSTIVHGAAALVLFTQSELVAQHDLRIVTERCINKGLTDSMPRVMSVPIVDRIGNQRCTVALFEARRGAAD